MRKLLLVVLTASTLAVGLPGAATADKLQGEGFTIEAPPGWKQVPPEEIDLFETLLVSDGATEERLDIGHALCREGATVWFDFPFILVTVHREGRASAKNLEELQSGKLHGAETARSQEAGEPINSQGSTGSILELHFDETNNVVRYLREETAEGLDAVRTLSALVLTQEGCVELELVADTHTADAYRDLFDEFVASIELAPELVYQADAAAEGNGHSISTRNVGRLVAFAAVGILALVKAVARQVKRVSSALLS